MSASEPAGISGARRGSIALVAAAAAATLTAGVAQPAELATVTTQVKLTADTITGFYTGPATGLGSALGLLPESFSVTFPTDINGTFQWTDSSPLNLYNVINKVPMGPTGVYACGDGFAFGDKCRVPLVIADDFGVPGAIDAVKALFASAGGATLVPGYPPITEKGLTSVLQVLINNPLRPNGGLTARFDPEASLAPTGEVPIKGLSNSAMASNMIDLTWEYMPLSDFPAKFNLLALTNSLLANIPPAVLIDTFAGGAGVEGLVKLFEKVYFTKGVDGPTATPGLQTGSGAFQLALLYLAGSPGLPEQLTKMFLTVPYDDLPILAPLRLPGLAINSVLKNLKSPYLLGNPLADVLQPALKILINSAYTDVVTPTALANNPALAKEGFGPYDRTFTQNSTNTAFGTETLSPAENNAVAGDAWNAFVEAVTAQFAKPFWGILVPNPDNPPAANSLPAPAKANPAAATPALPQPESTTSVPLSVPAPAIGAPAVQSAPVAPVEAPAPVAAPVAVEAPAPVALEAPAKFEAPAPIEVPALADAAEVPAAQPSAPAHRGGSRGGDNGDSDSGASSGARGHRGAS